MNKRIHLLVSSGHGANTRGKNSTYHADDWGFDVLKENTFNEAIANKLSYGAYLEGLPFTHLNPEWYDVKLKEKVKRERRLYVKNKTIMLAMHADAIDKRICDCDPEGVVGLRIFYNSLRGLQLANHYTKFFKRGKIGTPVHEPRFARFMMLTKTASPAILIEHAFMTSGRDLALLTDDMWRNKIADIELSASLVLNEHPSIVF